MQSYIFAFSILVLSVGGALLQSSDITSFLAYAFILVVSAMPVLIAWGTFPKKTWPVIIFVVGVGVAWHTTLITNYIWGWDIHNIYYLAQQAHDTNSFHFSQPISTAALVVIVWFSAFLAALFDISIITAFKVIFPLISALGPLTIYLMTKKVVDRPIAAPLSAFVPIFFYRYFKTMPTKQSIAQVFLALILLSQLSSFGSINKRKRLVVLLLISGIILSHYATSIFLLGMLVSGILIISIHGKLISNSKIAVGSEKTHIVISSTILLVIWYWYYVSVTEALVVKHSSLLIVAAIAKIFQLVGILPDSGQKVASRSGAGYLPRIISQPELAITGLLTLMVIFFIYLGIAGCIWRSVHNRDSMPLFYGLALSASAFTVAGILLPFGLGFDRVTAMTLTVMAPFLIPGIVFGRDLLMKIGLPIELNRAITSIALILGIWFIFSSGLAFVPGGSVPDYALGVDNHGEWMTYNQEEVTASRWIPRYTSGNVSVLSSGARVNERDGLLLAGQYGRNALIQLKPWYTKLPESCSVVYRSKKSMHDPKTGEWIDVSRKEVGSKIQQSNKIYDTGSAQVTTCGH